MVFIVYPKQVRVKSEGGENQMGMEFKERLGGSGGLCCIFGNQGAPWIPTSRHV